MLFFAVIAFKRLNEVFAQFALHMCGCHFKKNDERNPPRVIFIQEGTTYWLLNARPKKNCSRFPTGIAAACQRCWKNVQYHQHYSYSWESLKWAICFAIFGSKMTHCACSSLAKVWDDDPAVPPLRKSPQKINTVSCHPYCQEVLRFFSYQQLWKSLQICTYMHIQEI